MAGKHKNKRTNNHKNNSSSNNFSPKLSEQDLCDLVTQATQLHTLLNQRYQKLKKSQDFVYVLSTKWLREWKDYVGYEGLFSDDKEGGKKTGKKRPGPPNTDITASTKGYLQIPQQLQQYSYLNIAISDKMSQGDDYIPITQQIWQQFNQRYGPGTQIKRPFRLTKSKTLYVDSQLLKCDFIFLDYGMEDFQNKFQHVKLNKAQIQNLVPSQTVQMSAIWELEDLYMFFSRLGLVKYNNQKVTLWLCHNYLGTYSWQQNLVKAIKSKSYELCAYKILIQQYQNLDIEDIIKQNYTIIVQIGDSRLKTSDLPQQLTGYCQSCVQKKLLSYNCACNHKHYCSRECQIDDQVYHFNICKQSFSNNDDEQYENKKIKGTSHISKCGLKNLGNTCYMNSSLQMFLGIDFLVDFLGTNQYKNAISDKEKYADMFLKSISKFCKQMGQQTELGFCLQPWQVKGKVNYFLPPFKGYKQHDAIDFFMSFLNTINECLIKKQDEAYNQLIKQNILGQFDSLVICPECDNQVKNVQCFTQLTLPIKTKAKKLLYNYVLFDNPNTHKYGKAQVKQSWGYIKSNLGVQQNCIIFSGAQNQSGYTQIDFDASCETFFKKHKKQLLFFPYLKIKQGQILFSANFITYKSMSGYNMKANSGYPFPVVANNKLTIGHFIISIIQTINIYQNRQLFRQIQSKYNEIITIHTQQQQNLKLQQQNKEQKTQPQPKQQKNSPTNNKKNKKLQQQQSPQKKLINKLQKQLQALNTQLIQIMESLNIKIFIQDTKKMRNICFFCKKKCEACPLLPDFGSSIQDLLGLKVGQAKIYINLLNKPLSDKIKQDLASSGDPSLKDCLTLFAQPQKLDQQNAWWCHQCQDLRLALKQLHISKFPKYLIIQLSRFKNGQNGKIKNNEPISYSEYQIFNNRKYKLLSAIVHEGSIDAGHYWAICRRGQDYYIFNDDKVSKTDKICNKNAYILCYKRQQELDNENMLDGTQQKQQHKYKLKQKQKQGQNVQKQTKKNKKNNKKKAQ